MAQGKRTSPEQEAAVLDDLGKGYNISHTARRQGLDRGTVSRIYHDARQARLRQLRGEPHANL